MSDKLPRKIHEEKLCCGFKRCVEIKIFEDGSVELSDDDAAIGSVGTIKLRPEAASRLIMLLTHQGS